MLRRSIWAMLLALLAVFSARADYLEVRRPATVYSESSRTSDPVFQASAGALLTLLDPDTQNGYYHVQDTNTGQSGWVYRTLVRRHPGLPTASPAATSATGAGFPAKKCAPPYNEEASAATPFDQSCGLSGDAKNDSGEFPQNLSKNDLCEKASPIQVTIANLRELQKLVDDTQVPYGNKMQGKAGPPKDRTVFHNLPALNNGSKIEEDEVVTYVGFLVEQHYMPQSEKPPKNGKGGETVNCNSTEHAKADIHLALSDVKGRITAKDADRTKKLCTTVSAEMIPHLRPGVWNTDTLDQVIDLERPIKVTGHLFFDASHEPCTGPTPVGSDPRRITEWEIHPVYTFEICKFDSVSKCDANKPDSWQQLSKAAGIALERELDN